MAILLGSLLFWALLLWWPLLLEVEGSLEDESRLEASLRCRPGGREFRVQGLAVPGQGWALLEELGRPAARPGPRDRARGTGRHSLSWRQAAGLVRQALCLSRRSLGRLTVYHLVWEMRVGLGEALGTALVGGLLLGWAGVARQNLRLNDRVKDREPLVRVEPSFNQPGLVVHCHCILGWRLIYIIAAGLEAGVAARRTVSHHHSRLPAGAQLGGVKNGGRR